MKPKDFVTTYLPFAQEAQIVTGIHPIAILAQAALESGWGERVPGNMFFGIKDKDKGKTGKGQLIVTTEYFKTRNNGHLFPEVISITWHERRNRWKYVVRDWFRKYDSPAGSFTDHGNLFVTVPRYAEAMKHAGNPVRFLQEVAKAGYATAPDYAKLLVQLANMIQKLMPSDLESFGVPVESEFFEMPSEEDLWDYRPQEDATDEG